MCVWAGAGRGRAAKSDASHTWQGGGERAGSRPRHTAVALSRRLATSGSITGFYLKNRI